MSNISNYSANAGKPVQYVKTNDTTKKIQNFAKYLHDFLPVLQAEFDSLESINEVRPNEVFPIKMQALSDIYNAAQPLYEWYVEKAKRY